MPTHRPVRVGVAVLGVLGLTAPAWGQAAPPRQPPAAPGAYEGFVPLLERDEPQPSFFDEASPPAHAKPAEAVAEPVGSPRTTDGEQAADDGESQ